MVCELITGHEEAGAKITTIVADDDTTTYVKVRNTLIQPFPP